MKPNPKMRRILLLGCVVFAAVLLTGCAIPTDPETHEIIQITPTTTFSQIMSTESWFSAILVWPMAQFLNLLTPYIGVAGAIALLTIIVNGILMIFTLKSTIATQQMQLLQPEMEKIQRKYEGKDDDASKMKHQSAEHDSCQLPAVPDHHLGLPGGAACDRGQDRYLLRSPA